MNVLLLRLAGPMQSWGTQSRFTVRDTGLEPSKSGVLGLICAALGRSRRDSIDDLASLRMGVRADHEGIMRSDFQTTLNVVKASGKKSKPGEAVTSTRYYLADADFLVGLEGDDLALLKKVHTALKKPCWPLFLGRKAFPPAESPYLENGLKAGEELLNALLTYPWCRRKNDKNTKLRFVLECPEGEIVHIDQPVSSFAERSFAPRHITVEFEPPSKIVSQEEPCTSRI